MTKEDNDEQSKEYQKQYYLANKEEIKERKKQYNIDNQDKVKEQKKQYRIANIDQVKAGEKKHYYNNRGKILKRAKKYNEKNKDKIKKYRDVNKDKIKLQKQIYGQNNRADSRRRTQQRRARQKQLETTLTEEEWQKILDDHFHCCHYCGRKSDSLQQEHKIPVSKGGGYTAQNIVPACKKCNNEKYNKNYKKFAKNGVNRLQMKLFED